MDSELSACLLKFIEYFSDDLSALSRTLLRFFGQPLSKQLYVIGLHAVQFGNNWMRKIRRKIWQSEEFFEYVDNIGF